MRRCTVFCCFPRNSRSREAKLPSPTRKGVKGTGREPPVGIWNDADPWFAVALSDSEPSRMRGSEPPRSRNRSVSAPGAKYVNGSVAV